MKSKKIAHEWTAYEMPALLNGSPTKEKECKICGVTVARLLQSRNSNRIVFLDKNRNELKACPDCLE